MNAATCGLVNLTTGQPCILPAGHAHTCLPAPARSLEVTR